VVVAGTHIFLHEHGFVMGVGACTASRLATTSPRTGELQKAAQAIKEGLDKKFGPTWHCVVGEGFGFNITFNAHHMQYVYYGEKLGILIYKC
jgi:dynein light chain 4